MAETLKRGVAFNGTKMAFSQRPTGSATTAITSFDIPSPDIGADGTPIPPTANATGHGLEDGDVVLIESETNGGINGLYVVKKEDEDSFKVGGMTAAKANNVTDAKFIKVDMGNYCFATSYTEEIATTSSEDKTTNCDNYPYEESTVTAGTLQIGVLFQDDATHRRFENLLLDQESIVFQYQHKGSNQLRSFKGTVSAWSKTAEANGDFTGDMTIQLQSRPIDVTLS